MKKYAGIWIDLKKAIIIFLEGKSATSKTIYSNIETRERYEGEGKVFGRFGDQYLTHEKQKEKRLEKEVGEFAKRVLNEIGKVEKLVVFGPAQMKDKLKKKIQQNRNLSSVLTEVKSADSMTDNQVAAMVKDYFEL
jgi:pantothenate kinase-related protein Tda10